MRKSLLVVGSLAAFDRFAVDGFQLWHPTTACTRHRKVSLLRSEAEKKEWGVGDDWNKLWDEENHHTDVAVGQDFARIAAYKMQDMSWEAQEKSSEEEWLTGALDNVLTDDDEEASSELDTFVDEDAPSMSAQDFLDDMGQEIAMLVRCNQSPEEMLIAAGKALPRLDVEDRNNVLQMLEWDEASGFQPTPFLKSAIKTLFNCHAKKIEGEHVMDPKGVSTWLIKSLDGEPCGPHDPRVTQVISKHGDYGSGALTEKNLLQLYLTTLIGKSTSPDHLQYRTKERDMVWRDLRNHGLLAPVEKERARLMEQIREKYDSFSRTTDDETLMDECEVEYDQMATWKQEEEGGEWKRSGKSSHELVELADDNKTPLRLQDGDFIFIDEESCIGCMQCATAAPGSFTMVDDGRARTYDQRKTPDVKAAVASCPVSCMHRVGFDRLKKLETVRDHGDGREDHRHFGKNHRTGGWISKTPLHLSRRDSDANHKSSWYHYLTQKCHLSSDCPKAGCYDCPFYDTPGSNPFCQAKMKDAVHVRAQHLIRSGVAAKYRKTADL